VSYQFPNLLARVREFLDTALTEPVHAIRTPAGATYPLVLVTAVSTAPLTGATDKLAQARIQVECYGQTAQDEAASWALAARAHLAFHGISNEPDFSGFTTETGPQLIPDRELGKARHIFDVRVYGYTPRQVI